MKNTDIERLYSNKFYYFIYAYHNNHNNHSTLRPETLFSKRNSPVCLKKYSTISLIFLLETDFSLPLSALMSD